MKLKNHSCVQRTDTCAALHMLTHMNNLCRCICIKLSGKMYLYASPYTELKDTTYDYGEKHNEQLYGRSIFIWDN